MTSTPTHAEITSTEREFIARIAAEGHALIGAGFVQPHRPTAPGTAFDHEPSDCPVRQDVSTAGQPPEYLHGYCANYEPDQPTVWLREAEEHAARAAELAVPGQRMDVINLHLVKAEVALLHAKIAAFRTERQTGKDLT